MTTSSNEDAAKAGSVSPTALSGLKVLDLTTSSEQYCGKLLAQLGADVVLIEPLAGSQTRRKGPFLNHNVHMECSLPFAYFNQGKRGMTLDLGRTEAQEVIRRLVAEADILLESSKPGALAHWGLDFDALSVVNPRLVMTSITPFGQTGPFAQCEATDLTIMALGGMLSLGGYPDTEPIAAPGDQALLAAAQFAAVATLMAVWDVEGSDAEARGQHVDISVQEAVSMGLETAVQFAELEGFVRRRQGGEQRLAGMGVFSCSDGLIYLMAGGLGGGRFWPGSIQWLIDEGVEGAEALMDPKWMDRDYIATQEAKDIFSEVFAPFAAARSKEELYREAQRRRLPLAPINTPKDVSQARQLHHRDFFKQALHPYTGTTLTMPGAPYILSTTPWQSGRPAPRLGEHNCEILTELAYSLSEQEALLNAGVTA